MSEHRGDPAVYVFQQIAAALRSRILHGDLVAGQKMPSQAELAAEFSVAALTARAALQVLRDEGLIVSRRGTRSCVADRPSVTPAVAVTPLVRVHRHEPVLAIKWPQFDRWLMVWPRQFAGEDEPAATTEWRPVLYPESDLSGDEWIDPAAAHHVDISGYTRRLRDQLATTAAQLSLIVKNVDELERHPWNG